MFSCLPYTFQHQTQGRTLEESNHNKSTTNNQPNSQLLKMDVQDNMFTLQTIKMCF